MRSTILGFVAALVVIYIAVNSIHSLNLLLDPTSFVIVLGGTVAAGIITFGVPDMLGILKNTLRVFSRPKISLDETIEEVLRVTARMDKNPKLYGLSEEFRDTHPFLRDGLRLIENGLSSDEIQNILETDMEKRKERHLHQVEVLKTLAKYPPAFGMIGTVIGLVGLMSNLNKDSSSMVGPAMAIALLTTLYGLLFANYFFVPMSDNLLHRLADDMAGRDIILRGVLMIKDKIDPLVIKENLMVHAAPAKRNKIRSIEV